MKRNHNIVILTGRLTKKPELKILNSGHKLVNDSIATPLFMDRTGSFKSGFFPIVAWDDQAADLALHTDKGDMITIEGKLNYREYETKDGYKRNIVEIIVNNYIPIDVAGLTKPYETEKEIANAENNGFTELEEMEEPF